MCEAPICKCHCVAPGGLTLEVGKTYQTQGSGKVVIICKDGDMFVGKKLLLTFNNNASPELWGYHGDGKRYGTTNYIPSTSILSEYKEPRITKRDVILYGPTEANKSYVPEYRHVWSGEVGGGLYKGNPGYWREISRQTVTFKEEA